jgi:hypothetical protein
VTPAEPPPLPPSTLSKPIAATAVSVEATLPAHTLIGALPPQASVEKGAATAKTNQRPKLVAIAIGAAGVLVFVAVGYLVYGKFKHEKADEKPAQKSPSRGTDAAKPINPRDAGATKTPPGAAGQTPTSIPTPSSADTSLAPPPAVSVPVSAAPQEPPPPQSPTPNPPPATAISTPPAATTPAIAERIEPSPAFVRWVNNLKITGTRGGNAPRVLIERATFGVGDTVNADLGITFDGFDSVRHILRFKDKTGAVVERRDRM